MKRIVLALTLFACGGSRAPAPVTEASAAPPPPARAPGPWTTIPALGVRVGCEGELQMMLSQLKMATVLCGKHVLGIRLVPDARTIDDAIGGQAAERTAMLQAGAANVKRTDRLYRHAYENDPGVGTNYWVDVVVEIDGRVFVCQTGSMAPKGTRALADEAGDLCETLAAID